MNLDTSIATTKLEVEEALDLVVKSFSSNVNNSSFREDKLLDWQNFNFFKENNIVVVRDFGCIIGVVRIVYRTVYINSKPYKAAGFSDVCVSNKYRGKGVSIKLMKYAIDIASINCDISILFASKNVDYYYNKFGFWGVSTYNKIVIECRQFFIDNVQNIFFRDILSIDLDYCSCLYESNYYDFNGFIERTPEYWNYLLVKTQRQKYNFKAIIYNDVLCGYCIYKENVIYEIAFNSFINVKDVLSLFDQKSKVKIWVDPHHSIVDQLQSFDYTVHHRNCIFGGHMLKILNKQIGKSLQDVYDFFNIKDTTVINFNTLDQF